MTTKSTLSERVYDTAVTRYVNAELERMSINNKADDKLKIITNYMPALIAIVFVITLSGLIFLDNFK